MAKFAKKEKVESSNGSSLRDPEIRKKFKSALAVITHYFKQIDDLKEGVSESIAADASEYGLDKKTIRKLAVTMYKANYGTLQEENRAFEALYEIVVEGKLRDPDGIKDPLDKQIDDAVDASED